MCFLSFCWYKYKQENVYARAFHSFWFVIENYAPRHGVMKENKKKKKWKFWIQTVSCLLSTMSSLHGTHFHGKWCCTMWKIIFPPFLPFVPVNTKHSHRKCYRARILSRDNFKWFRTQVLLTFCDLKLFWLFKMCATPKSVRTKISKWPEARKKMEYRTKMHSEWCDEWQDGNFFIAWNWNWNNSLTRKLLQNDVERFYDQARAERYKKYFLILDNMYTSHSSESRVLLKCSMKKHLTPISSSSA